MNWSQFDSNKLGIITHENGGSYIEHFPSHRQKALIKLILYKIIHTLYDEGYYNQIFFLTIVVDFFNRVIYMVMIKYTTKKIFYIQNGQYNL